MTRLNEYQINLIRNKAFDNLRVLFERYPSEEEKLYIEKKLEETIPVKTIKMNLEKAEKESLEAHRKLQKVMFESQDALTSGTESEYRFNKLPFMYCPDYTLQFDKFMETERERIAKREGLLKTLNRNKVLTLLYDNILFTPVRRKEMDDILQEVVQKTFNDMKGNIDEYFVK